MDKVVLLIAVLIVIAISILIIEQPAQLKYSEVRNYQGKDLSSINDIKDNAINGPQNIDISNYTLIVTGLVNSTKEYSYEEVLGKPHYQKVVRLLCVEGWDATILWEGVLVKDLLADAGADPRAKVAIFYASDGYTTSLPISYLEDNNIMLAYKMNGVVLPAEKGFPFQLVAESQYGYKWIKWITKIEVSDNESYEGYWESIGYPNRADIPK
jgi:DMSO/TMAO reductase YedYZ molybdopterin-dependent catalytic subunit